MTTRTPGRSVWHDPTQQSWDRFIGGIRLNIELKPARKVRMRVGNTTLDIRAGTATSGSFELIADGDVHSFRLRPGERLTMVDGDDPGTWTVTPEG